MKIFCNCCIFCRLYTFVHDFSITQDKFCDLLRFQSNDRRKTKDIINIFSFASPVVRLARVIFKFCCCCCCFSSQTSKFWTALRPLRLLHDWLLAVQTHFYSIKRYLCKIPLYRKKIREDGDFAIYCTSFISSVATNNRKYQTHSVNSIAKGMFAKILLFLLVSWTSWIGGSTMLRANEMVENYWEFEHTKGKKEMLLHMNTVLFCSQFCTITK